VHVHVYIKLFLLLYCYDFCICLLFSGVEGSQHNLASGSGVSDRSGQSAPRSITATGESYQELIRVHVYHIQYYCLLMTGVPPESLAGASVVVAQDSTPEDPTPSTGIFLQTASYLLDSHALKVPLIHVHVSLNHTCTITCTCACIHVCKLHVSNYTFYHDMCT